MFRFWRPNAAGLAPLRIVLFAAACLLGLSATTAQEVSLIPDADARLANDTDRGPTSSTGTTAQWEIRWHEAPRVRIGYVRYDITSVDSALFPSATISGTFSDGSRNGPADGSGIWNVYGLNDDVVASGGIQGNDWDEATINYSNAAGVDNTAALDTFAFTSDVTLLGTLSPEGVDEEPFPFASNTIDLNLTTFLNADTDGLVTFLFMSITQDGFEYRINSKEGNMDDGHGPTTLNFDFVPSCFEPGDIDCENGVDLVDLGIIAAHFRQNGTRDNGDLTGDGFIDFDDFNEWKQNYPGAFPGSGAFSFLGVPEPGSMALLVCGAVGLLSVGGRRRVIHTSKE